MTIPEGRYKGYVAEEPEYEQMAAWGSVIDNKDAAAAVMLSGLTDARAESFRIRRSGNVISTVDGYFQAPSTIVYDETLLLEGQRFHQAELATTATYYTAVHEVIHADDYANGNRLIQDTLRTRAQSHAF